MYTYIRTWIICIYTCVDGLYVCIHVSKMDCMYIYKHVYKYICTHFHTGRVFRCFEGRKNDLTQFDNCFVSIQGIPSALTCVFAYVYIYTCIC